MPIRFLPRVEADREAGPRAGRRGRRPGPAAVLAVLGACLLLASSAAAFKGQEHIKGSNCALGLVLKRIDACSCSGRDEIPDGCEECLSGRQILEEFHDSGVSCDPGAKAPKSLKKSEQAQYGLLVSTIDYLLDPLEYLEFSSPANGPREDAREEMKRYLERARSYLRHSWSAHNNEVHFQSEALEGFWYWHSSAVGIAAHGYVRPDGTTEHNLRAALLVNSIGDHFLQDSLAPGHVLTPRNSMHDLVAMSMHDRYNVVGAQYVLPDVCELRDGLGTGGASSEPSQQELADAPALLRAPCGERFTVDLWGDGYLHRSPDQAALFVLLTARSILDVVRAYSTGTAQSSFEGYEWHPMRKRREETNDGGESRSRKRIDLATAGFPPFGGYGEKSVGPLFYGGTSLAFGYSSEYFFTRAGDEPGRGVFSLELVPALFPPGRKGDDGEDGEYEPVNHQWLLAAGYAWVYNKSLHGGGPTLRLIRAIPKIDLSLSAEVGLRSIRAATGVEWTRPHYGVRADLGFSLLTLHLGVARAYYRQEEGELVPDPIDRRPVLVSREVPSSGYAIRAGVSVGLPLSKISRAVGLNRLVRGRAAKQLLGAAEENRSPDTRVASRD